MKTIAIAAAMALIAAGPVLAQPHDDHHGGPGPAMHGPAMHGGPGGFVKHDDWKNGGHINHDDWNRGAPVDYRSHHLRKPKRGYEWREVDGNYVLAAAATGLIAGLALSH